MAADSLSQFLDHLYQSQLLQPGQIEELIRRPEMPTSDVDSVGDFLEERGWLTRFQIDRLKEGRGGELFLTGGYRLTNLLSETAAGTTFKAFQLALQRFVLLRLVHVEWLAPCESTSDFLAKAHAITLLSHPHLVNALDSGTLNDRPYITLELVEGMDLGTLVRNMGPMPLVLACDYIMQAAMALRAGHERGIYHGDLSPTSLMVTPIQAGEGPIPAPGAIVKVAELGLVPVRPPLNEWPFETPVASVAYLPPERFTNGQPTARGDVFSLGGILYFVLTGNPPFPATSLPEAIQKLQTAEPTPIEMMRADVPEPVVALLRRMMSKSCDFRPDMAEVIEGLRPYAGSQSTAMAVPPTVNSNGVPFASLTGTTLESTQLSPPHTPEIPMAGPVSDVIVEAQPIYSPGSIPVAEVIVDDSATPAAQAIPMQGFTPGMQVPAYSSMLPAEPVYDHEEHHDPFGHHHHDDASSEPRESRKAEKGSWVMWAVLGGLLHITAMLLLVGFVLGWFDSSPEPPPTKAQPNKSSTKYPKAPSR